MFEHIANMKQFSQQICFSGLQFERSIRPTDIDGFLEFDGVEFIFLEFKFKGKDLPWGQRLAYTRMCEAMTRGGVQVLLLVAEHETQPNSHVSAHLCSVKETWISDRGWRKPSKLMTVKECIDLWRKHWRDKAKIVAYDFPPELQNLPLFQPPQIA